MLTSFDKTTTRTMNVISVDVGSTGVRAAIVAFDGQEYKGARILASHEKDIKYYQNNERFVQSSFEIWQAVCECTKACLEKVGKGTPVDGIGFSATCSLVTQQTTITTTTTTGKNQMDVIMWMDHRAKKEAQFITDNKSRVLDQLGGVCSPEFSLAKILWLRNNEPSTLSSSTDTSLFELPDWLAWRCISNDPNHCPRSLCCLTCKWGYNAELKCHCDIIKSIEDTIEAVNFSQEVLKPGTIAGYLSLQAAQELGIISNNQEGSSESSQSLSATVDIVVGTSLIDAHSGMLAMLSAKPGHLSIEDTFCSLAGTSSCHMLLSHEKKFCHGIWGPYKDVVLDNYYLLESGQTLTGRLIEICIERHREGRLLLENNVPIKQIIQNANKDIELKGPESDIHILPTFHGNRSPLANPRLAGGIYGLTVNGEGDLLHHYISAVEAVVFETKLIVETLKVDHLGNILVSGGLMKNRFYMQTLADVLQCKAIKMSLQDVDFMVMGAALVARCAVINKKSGLDPTNQALDEQHIEGIQYDQLNMEVYEPNPDPARAEYLRKKYACYKEFVDFSQRVDKILHSRDCSKKA